MVLNLVLLFLNKIFRHLEVSSEKTQSQQKSYLENYKQL